MRTDLWIAIAAAAVAGAGEPAAQQASQPAQADPVQTLVARLDLEKYKATIKGLTQFGDRREGTDRNRAAIDWIEAQLKSYGCPTERLQYVRQGAQGARGAQGAQGARGAQSAQGAQGAQGRGTQTAEGGGRRRGIRARTGVNNNPELQPDLALRALNSQPSTPGPREEVYCTKVGATRPDEMYIVGAHMDGHGWGQAANDNGSGTALVMELARILNTPDVVTDRSIRFILWNNEETGLNGSRAYVEQRRERQGRED